MFYGNDPRPGDNQEHPIKVEKDEYVVNRNAARKHRSLLDYINFVDEPRYDNKEMAHSSIDEAISLNTLSGMQEGGMSGYQDVGDVKAYIDSSDSSVVVANPKQSKMFDEIVNSVTFAPKTSKKYQLETIIDMLNNPDKYKEDVDADFPVTGESIGAVDSLASYMSKFNKDIDFMGYGDEEAGILEQFGRPEFRRAGRTAQDEGFIMNEEEIGKALNYLAKRHQERTLGMGVRGMQDGGSTYGYGSQVSTSPTFEDLYAYAGIEPSPEQRAKFEGNFRYDPSREEGTIDDYIRGVENLQKTGQGTLRSAGVKSRAAGAGFGGFGKREEMQDLAGSAARSEYSSGLGQAQQDRFESIRGQRESWMTEAMGELGRIEELGGTDVYEEPTEPPNFLTGQGDSNPEGWTGGTPTAGTNFTDTNGVSWRFVDIPGVGGLWQEQT